jgi:amino acid transporter
MLEAYLPILAHGESESATLSELLFSVGLLVLSGALAATLLLAIFLKPIRRELRKRKEGKPASPNLPLYLAVSALVVIGFLSFCYDFGMGLYYDYHFEKFEETEKATGRHARGGAEYKWKRWHINGRYFPNNLSLAIEDVLRTADPSKLSVQARLVSPTPSDWRPMQWDVAKKTFVAEFKPEGEKMDFEFEIASGWSSYRDTIIGYVPRGTSPGAVQAPHHEGDGHDH